MRTQTKTRNIKAPNFQHRGKKNRGRFIENTWAS